MQNFQFVMIGEEFGDPVGGQRWVKISETEACLVSDESVVEEFDRRDLTTD